MGIMYHFLKLTSPKWSQIISLVIHVLDQRKTYSGLSFATISNTKILIHLNLFPNHTVLKVSTTHNTKDFSEKITKIEIKFGL